MTMSPETKRQITVGALVSLLCSMFAVLFAIWGGGFRAGAAIESATEARRIANQANDRSHSNYADMREIKANQRNILSVLTKMEAGIDRLNDRVSK